MVDFTVQLNGADKLLSQGVMNLNWQYSAAQQESSISFEKQNTQIGYVTDDEFDYHTIAKRSSKDFDKSTKWIGVRQRFFFTILVAKNNFTSGKMEWTIPSDEQAPSRCPPSRLTGPAPGPGTHGSSIPNFQTPPSLWASSLLSPYHGALENVRFKLTELYRHHHHQMYVYHDRLKRRFFFFSPSSSFSVFFLDSCLPELIGGPKVHVRTQRSCLEPSCRTGSRPGVTQSHGRSILISDAKKFLLSHLFALVVHSSIHTHLPVLACPLIHIMASPDFANHGCETARDCYSALRTSPGWDP
jgi:hypothetical protein